MSLKLYDDAFLNKLKKITEKTNIHLIGTDDTKRLFQVMADTTNDQPIELPIICLHRADGYTIKEIGNNPRSKNNTTIKSMISNNGGGAIQLNIIPISINYQIDVYTRKFQEADDIMRELVFILTNSPQISVVIPYNDLQYQHKSNITLNTQIKDNSSIPERLIAGQFSRLSIECSINDAYLFDTRVKSFIDFGLCDLQIASSNEDIIIEPLDMNKSVDVKI